MTNTEADFTRLSWHDCYIWAIQFSVGDPEDGDWTSDLVLDIDFIVDWICRDGEKLQFRVAPAMLVFHNVTDSMIEIGWGHSGFQVSLHPVSIEQIKRERIQDQKVYLDRPYYKWTIRTNFPVEGEISFGATGFTQTLRAEPVLTEKQCLSMKERKQLTAYL